MYRGYLFARRNFTEILRDPLSYIFCLFLPVGMIAVMHYAFYSEAVFWFDLPYLVPGVAVFSLSFTMLNTTLLVSRDRALAFLTRLYVSPMRPVEFIFGYTVPGVVLGICQLITCYASGWIISLIKGQTYASLSAVLLSLFSLVPVIFFFVGLGILFGSLFSMQSAPGMVSAVITVSGFLSGAWTPIETLSAAFRAVCSSLPFYPAVEMGRTFFLNRGVNFENFWSHFLIVLPYAVAIFTVSVIVFARRTRRD